MHTESPIQGKRVLLEMDEHPAIRDRLRERVKEAGGEVVHNGAADVTLKLSVLENRAAGVAASYWWLSGTDTRRIAMSLTRAVAEECGLPDQGPRVSLGGRQVAMPSVEVQIARPGQPDLPNPERIVAGLFTGLVRAWSERATGAASATPDSASGLEVDNEGPRIVLFPDPDIVPDPMPKTEAEYASVATATTTTTRAPLEPPAVTETASNPEHIPEPSPEEAVDESSETVQVLDADTVVVLDPDPAPAPPENLVAPQAHPSATAASFPNLTPLSRGAAPIRPVQVGQIRFRAPRLKQVDLFRDPRVLQALGRGTVFQRVGTDPPLQTAPAAQAPEPAPVTEAPRTAPAAPPPAPAAGTPAPPPEPAIPAAHAQPPAPEAHAPASAAPAPAPQTKRPRLIMHDGSVIRFR